MCPSYKEGSGHSFALYPSQIPDSLSASWCIYWTVHMNIMLAFAHSTASWSSHLNMKIAQLVWGLFEPAKYVYGVASFVAEWSA